MTAGMRFPTRFSGFHLCSPPFQRRGVGSVLALALALLLPTAAAAAPAQAPPGFNVHLVVQREGRCFWRGGAPRQDTLALLAASARQRGVAVTLIDLRVPPTADDQSGKQGRLSPAAEGALARQLGIQYLPVSALDRQLDDRLAEALAQGDVYMHCMYGVNRTGFATARFASATGSNVDRAGLGPRDWSQGAAFAARLARAGRPRAVARPAPRPAAPTRPVPAGYREAALMAVLSAGNLSLLAAPGVAPVRFEAGQSGQEP